MPDMEKGNPDAAQDEGLIQSVISRELGPIFEAIGARLRDFEEDLGETKDLLFKFTQGLIGAADSQKRSSLSDELSGKYGKDMEPYEGFHKEVYGKGLSDSLIEELMGDEAPGDDERDEWIKGRLGEAKSRFGKYVGVKEEVLPAEGEDALEAAPAEAPMAEEAPPEEAPPEEAPPEEAPEEEPDAVSKIMSQMKSLGGDRHKLSESLSNKKMKVKEAH